MAQIFTSIEIARPIDEVFEYITTPAHWPEWHTTALGVSGAIDHSLLPGETVGVVIRGNRFEPNNYDVVAEFDYDKYREADATNVTGVVIENNVLSDGRPGNS